MKRQRIVVLCVFLLVIISLVSSIVVWRQEIQARQNTFRKNDPEAIENMNKEVSFLLRRLDDLFRQLDGMYQLPFIKLPLPTNGVESSFHDNGYRGARIVDKREERSLVEVATIESGIDIIFDPGRENLSDFRVGWIAPVTLTCKRNAEGDCDGISDYQAFISNKLVKIKNWVFLKDRSQPKKAIVHHAPGDRDVPYSEGIMMDIQNDSDSVYVQGKLLNIKDVKKISKIKRGDRIKVFLPENRPYRVSVNGAEMAIVAISF